MNGFFEGLLSNRPLVVAVSVLVILAYIVIRWRRAGRYVEDRNKLYSEHYKKVFEYSDRVRSDQRWPGFLAMIQERHPVVDTGEPSDEETSRFTTAPSGMPVEPSTNPIRPNRESQASQLS